MKQIGILVQRRGLGQHFHAKKPSHVRLQCCAANGKKTIIFCRVANPYVKPHRRVRVWKPRICSGNEKSCVRARRGGQKRGCWNGLELSAARPGIPYRGLRRSGVALNDQVFASRASELIPRTDVVHSRCRVCAGESYYIAGSRYCARG